MEKAPTGYFANTASPPPPQEVTDKGHRITQLEQEKSALIKQLFGARAESTKDSNQLDSTFI